MSPSSGRKAAFHPCLFLCIALLFASGLVCAAAPTITTQPTNTTVDAGGTATFTVVATTSNPPLKYKWMLNAAPVSGGTSSTLTITNVSDSQAGNYIVQVSDNSSGTNNSAIAVLTVLHPPIIASQPANQVLTNGDEAIFDVGVNGSNLSYQWLSNNVPLTGETNPVLYIYPVSIGDAASYSVVVTNSDGSATSSAALLTVVQQQLVTSQSIAVPVNTCTNLSFSVITYGTDSPLAYQWYKDGNPVGVNSSTYTVTGVQFADAGTYSVTVSDAQGANATTSASITVADPPPVVITKNIAIQLDASGNASIAAGDVNNGSYDNCGISGMSVTPGTFTCANVGTNIVTLYVMDNSNQMASASATVVVRDVTPPTVAFNSISVQLDNTGKYTLTAGDMSSIGAGSADACGIASFSVTPSSFGFCDAGSNTVTLTVTDANGNSVSTNGVITVLAPASAPQVVVVDTNYTGSCAAVTFPFTGGSGTYYIGYNAFSTIQAGVNAVATGGTVNVSAGTYVEAVSLSKRLVLNGAGSGNAPASNTIITVVPINTPVITISAGGASDTDRLVLSNLRVQGATGGSEVSASGIQIAAPGSHYTFSNVVAATNAGDGLAQNFGSGTNIDIIVTGCSFLNNGITGFRVPTAGSMDGLMVTNSHFDGNQYGLEVFMANGSGSVFQNVNISHSTFNNNSSKGIYVEKLNNASFSSITMTNSGYLGANAAGFNINLKYNAYANIQINDSDFINCGNGDTNVGGGLVIEARGTGNDSSYSNNPATLAGVALSDLNVTGCLDGIRFGEPGKNNVGPTGITIRDCNLSANTLNGIHNDTQTTTDAASNWWGNVSGPSGVANPYGTGSGVNGSVAFSPWLGDGTDTSANIGFQPNSSPAENPPTQLVFATEPSGANLGDPLSAQPVVQVEDVNGNVTPWANPVVTSALGNNTSGAVLAGTFAEQAVSGIATYTDLSVTISGGSNLALIASAPYLASATSDLFNITNPAPVISGINPFYARAGGSNTVLTVTGANFVADSIVYWNGVALLTTYVSSTQLTAIIPASDIASTGSANITVGSPGPGGGATAQLPFQIDVAVPPTVYVDSRYTGLAANKQVDWPYDTNSGPHIIGYDAFATIQNGVDAVASAGTVNVAAGTYEEDLYIGQPLNLVGPNASINPNTGSRVPEAIIKPATSDPNPFDAASEIVVYVATNAVSMEGFTVDGANADLGTNNAVLVGTNWVNAAEGIVSYQGVGSISVSNNIVKNTTYSGVDFYNYVVTASTSTNEICGNLFSNIGSTNFGYGIAVLIYNNFYAEVAYNVMAQVRSGVQTGNYSSSNPGNAQYQAIHDNAINAARIGIFHNLAYASASPYVLSNNTITAWQENGSATYDREWCGIVISSIQSSASATAINNTIIPLQSLATISGDNVGYNVWNTPTSGTISIQGGSVSNATYGVWINNYDGYDSATGTTKATVSGLNIVNASGAGVYVQDDPRASSHGNVIRATVTGNTTINGSVLGVLVQGTNAGASVLNNAASITADGVGVEVDTGVALLQNNDLTGNSVAGILATNGAIVDAGNCTGNNVTGLGTSSGGNNLSGYGFDNTAPWAILNANTANTSVVLAQDDNFGAGAGEVISAALSDAVNGIVFSQNPLLVTAPGPQTVECVSEVNPAATDLASFLAQGGTVTANSVTVSEMDSPAIAPETTTIRTYTLSDGCSTTTCQQTIIVHETNAPLIGSCPANFVSPGPTISYALPGATDDCGNGAVHVVGDPASGSTLGVGVHTVVCTAINHAGLSNSCSFEVVVPDPNLAQAYVDAGYSNLPAGTSVTWPNNGGTGSHYIGLDAFATIQGAVNAVASNATVQVAAGAYAESITVTKPMTLLGANAGLPGCPPRGAESVVNAGSGTSINIGCDGVRLDGFTLEGATGIVDVSHNGLVAQNNVILAAAAGVQLQNIITTNLPAILVQSNCVSLTGQLVSSTPTVGIGIAGVAGTVPPSIVGNSISGGFYGYLLYGLAATQPTIIKGGSVSGVMQGVSVLNINPLTLTSYAPSSFAVDGVEMSGFAGIYTNLPALSGIDFHAGVYVFTGGSNAATAVSGLITNVLVSGTGKISADSSGLYFADFSAGSNTMQQITVQGATVQHNSNRGIYVTGANAVVNVTESSVLDNGSDPYVTGGNPGFGIIARNNAQVAVSQSYIANPAVQTNNQVYALSANANVNPQGPNLTVSNSSIVNNGNGYLAWQTAGTLNASGNWWGTTDASAIADLMTGTVDFTPYLNSGTDTDTNTAGFQGDFGVVHVTALGSQTGATGRVQEGINDVVGGKVIIEAGVYAENVLANKTGLELAGIGQSSVSIIPAFAAPNPCPGAGSICDGASIVILVQASNVTIHDLTVDGHNPTLTSGVISGGVDLDARDGIIEDYNSGVFNNTVVYNTTVKNIYLRGIYASSGGKGFFFHDDIVQNVQADPASIGMFNFGGSGIMSNNVVSGAGDALSANWSTGTLFLNNTVTDSGSAVHTDNSSGPDVLAGNTASAMQPGAYGVWTFVPYGQVLISNNVISGCSVGLMCSGQGAATTPLFINNQVSAGAGAGSIGAYETTYIFGYGYTDVSSAFQGNNIQGTTYGFYLEDQSLNQLNAAITANNVVTGNNYGIYATGSPEAVKVENTDLHGNTVAALYATGGATVDAGSCGADVTGLGASAGGNDLSGYLTGPASAVVNANAGGSPVVYAYDDSFGATALQPEITSALNGAVLASQGGGLLATAPAAVSVQCPGDVPAAATSLAAYQTLGGVVSATAVNVAHSDSALNPGPWDGTVTRSYMLTDACGQTTTVQQMITVQDTTQPIITQCAPNQTINADATAHALLPDLTTSVVASDNCSPVTVTQSPLPNTQIGLGDTTVTLTATDASGNVSAPCTATVTVKDATAPNITCPPDVTATVLQDKDPFATGTAMATDAGASQQNQSIAITYSDDRSGLTNCDSTGKILRTWYAVDPSNNTNYCTQTITVIDDIAPIFTYVPANITTTNDLNVCGAVVSYGTATALDIGYSQGFENSNWVSGNFDTQPSVDWNDYGSHMYWASNGTGGIAASSGNGYAIIDSTSPEADQTGVFGRLGGYSSSFGTGYRVALDVYINLNDPSVQSATVANGYAWDLSAASSDQANGYLRDFIFHAAAYDNTGVVIATSNNSSDDASNRGGDLRSGHYATLTNSGWYTFEWIFRDTNGVLAVDLNVCDTNHNRLFTQTLSSPADQIATVVGGHRYLWFTFVNTDYLPVDNTILERNASVTSVLASGSSFPVGTTVVTNTATDACGNSTNTTFTVTVNDVQPPFIPALPDVTQNNDLGNCSAVVDFILPTNSITDNCNVATIVATPPSGSTFAVGTNLVTAVVTDIHSNSATNTFNVIVNDTEPPSANVPAAIVQNNDPGQCGAIVNFTIPAQTDNCGVATAVATPPSGTSFPVGTTPVTLVVTDIHGNSATNAFNVTVNDTEPPVVTCPSNIVQGVDAGQSYATVVFAPIVGDNCPGTTFVATPASGSQFPVGTNAVNVVATDAHGNSSDCSFTVQVVGLPQITQQPMGRTNNALTTATFSVVASSPTPLTYQWKKNGAPLSDGGNISGSATATLTIASVSDSDVAAYSVCVSNIAGAVLSANATLTVIDPPVIALQPLDITNNATTTATFTVLVDGTAPFGFQWYKGSNQLVDGGNISGSLTNVLVISNVLAADRGQYSVVVTNPAGTITSSNANLSVVDPWVVTPPANATQPLGGTVTFSVVAAGTTPLTYAWRQNSVAIPGATASSYTIGVIRDSDAGSYDVVVTGAAGTATSSPAVLTVTHPPVFVSQPQSVTVVVGQTASFGVSMNGTTPFTYQWQKNFVNIPGANGHTLVISGVTTNDAGEYDVVVTNADGAATSSNVTLTVIVPPSIVAQPASITNNAGTTASFTVLAQGTALTYQWFENETNRLADGGNIYGSATATLTLSNVLGANAALYSVVITNLGGTLVSSNASLTVIDPVITNEPASLTVVLGSPASFVVGVAGTSPAYQWRKNGTPISGATSSAYTLGAVSDSDGGSYDVVVTNVYGSTTSAPPAVLTVLDPPVITSQPADVTNNAGTTAIFAVSATGTAPLSYQWRKGTNNLVDGGNISGSANATLVISGVSDSDMAGYSVVISNVASTATSSSASLTVIDPPVLTSQPASITNVAGTTASFTITVAGTAPFSYQWKKGAANLVDGGNISGSQTATLTLSGVADADAGSYSVVVSNPAGTTNSSSASLTVLDPPLITSQPVSITNNAGTTAAFSVAATGTAPLNYQWKKGAANLVDGGNISGSQTATLVVANVSDADMAGYSVVISNTASTINSTTATLTVIDAPVITNEPVSITNNAGTTAIFIVGVSGTTPLSYQWYKDGTNLVGDSMHIIGATSNVLTLSNVFGVDRGQYSVVITNAAGSAASSNAMLSVIDPVITVQPTNTIGIDGTTVSFSVTVVGTGPLHYQWRQDDTALVDGFGITGSASSMLTISNVADSDAGNYSVVITNSEGIATSFEAELTTIPPLIVFQPTNVYVLVGQPFSFSVEVNGVSPFSYQWLKDDSNINGATNRIYGSSSALLSDTGSYKVIVTNPDGSETSSAAQLIVYSNTVPVVIFAGFSNGYPQIALQGVTSYTYELQASSNLTTWVPVETNTSPFTFTDTNGYSRRFYRGLYLP